MGYIRSNEDYYSSLGYSPSEAKVQAKLSEANIDYGSSNPKKIKLAQEEEDKIRKEIEEE